MVLRETSRSAPRVDCGMCHEPACLQCYPFPKSVLAALSAPIPSAASRFADTVARIRELGVPTDAKARKNLPITTGCLDYFPDALLAVAHLSKVGNDQHNPGQPLHWDRSKSQDHADCIGRHMLDRGTIDTDGQRHSAKVAWRALAMLQVEIEKEAE